MPSPKSPLSATFDLFAATSSRMLSIPGILRFGKGLEGAYNCLQVGTWI